MIFVQRGKEPNILTRNKAKWLADYLAAIEVNKKASSKRNKAAICTKENKYKHADVKRNLKIMFNDKCAYCESYIAHVSYGHIEHFRPKSTYPKQCFNWKNFLLGCEICNGSQYKATKFPLKRDNGPLINPTEENPSSFLLFEYDPATGTANVLGKNPRGDTTEITLGLNRPELVRHRSRIVRRMAVLAIHASQGNADALAEMRNLIKKDEEYSAFAITLFQKYRLKEYS